MFVEGSTNGKNVLSFLCCLSGAEGRLYPTVKPPAEPGFWVCGLALKEGTGIKKEYGGDDTTGQEQGCHKGTGYP